MSDPLVSVVIPVYNGAEHVQQSVESVLAQTVEELDVVVVDDGSTDATLDVLGMIEDPRVRVVRRDHEGIVAAANACLDEGRGRYLARHDADDVMAPERIERQLELMERCPQLVACGTDYEMFGARTGLVRMPRTPAACRARLLFGTCLAHGTALIRTEVLRDRRIRYREEYAYAEDYRFFSELAVVGDLANVPYVGLRYRIHDGQGSSFGRAAQRAVSARVSAENLARRGVRINDPETHDRALFIDGHGLRVAARHSLRSAPLLALGARAEGWHGLVTAGRLLRENLNSALRTTAGASQ